MLHEEIVEHAARLDNVVHILGVEIQRPEQYTPPCSQNPEGILNAVPAERE